jgi:hypothetical protein
MSVEATPALRPAIVSTSAGERRAWLSFIDSKVVHVISQVTRSKAESEVEGIENLPRLSFDNCLLNRLVEEDHNYVAR